jgi:hypothetical protein
MSHIIVAVAVVVVVVLLGLPFRGAIIRNTFTSSAPNAPHLLSAS